MAMNADAVSARLDATFLALADPTRRAILARLARGEATVTELAEPFAISQPAISKHLKILERAQLVRVGHDAQRRPRRLDGQPLAEASAWLEQYRDAWEAASPGSTCCSQKCSARVRPPGARGGGHNSDGSAVNLSPPTGGRRRRRRTPVRRMVPGAPSGRLEPMRS